jgi:uncharacterized membrane protein
MFGYESWCANVSGWGTGWCSSGWWTVCIAVMMLMMGLCFIFMMFMARRRKGNVMDCPPLFPKGEGSACQTSDSARDILDKRYATGEISAEEYEEKKRNLNQT